MSRDLPRHRVQWAWLVLHYTPFSQIQEFITEEQAPCQKRWQKVGLKPSSPGCQSVHFPPCSLEPFLAHSCYGWGFSHYWNFWSSKDYEHHTLPWGPTRTESAAATSPSHGSTVSKVPENPAGLIPLSYQFSWQALTLYIAHVTGKLRHRIQNGQVTCPNWYSLREVSLCPAYSKFIFRPHVE